LQKQQLSAIVKKDREADKMNPKASVYDRVNDSTHRRHYELNEKDVIFAHKCPNPLLIMKHIAV
jgi:hypothetical protein